MKKLALFLFFLGLSTALHADYGVNTDPNAAVIEAQQKVIEISTQLNDAVLNLDLVRLDWQRGKLVQKLAQAQQAGDTAAADQIQQKIADIDHRKDIQKQRHDLQAQIIQARQQNDQSKVDALDFQLRQLQ